MSVKKTSAASLLEMQEIVRLAAEPLRPHDNVKSKIWRAGRLLGIGYRRAYALWYSEPQAVVGEDEAARLRAERDRLYQLRLARLRQEIADTERRLEVLRRENALETAEAVAGVPVQPDCQLVLPLNGKPA